MVTEMTKYNFILLDGDKNNFLKKLQSLGVMDITRSIKPIDECSEKLFAHAETLKKALSLLNSIEKNGTTTPKQADVANDVINTFSEKDNLYARLPQLYKELEDRKPWGRFDIRSFEDLQKVGLKMHFFKEKKLHPEWSAQYALSVIDIVGGYTYFVIVSDTDEIDLPIKEIPVPSRDYTVIETEIATIENTISQKELHLSELKGCESEIQAELNTTLSKLDLFLASVSGQQTAENHISLFEGFAPAENRNALIEILDKENILYLVDKAKADDNPPIKLKNSKFVSMFEVLTDMYGRPNYNEFDPTIFISIFFMLFFAFCMGDAGYGLSLIILSLGLKKNMPKIAPLGITLGIATTIIGLLFHTFFSSDMLSWSCIPDGVKRCMLPAKIAGFDGTMVLAIIVGIAHICLAMIVKTYQATKTKGFFNALGTWGWTLLIVGGVSVGGLALIGVLNAVVTQWFIIGIGILSALGIFFLNDLHRNPLLNIGAGLWETYNTVTGLLGDVLSYLRLYALGLAGAKLGEAFNAIGMQAVGDGGLGWLIFILIVVVGHALNIAMCVLGAFVHPLRLNFLEFFKNSGYEGTGRKYNPL